MKNKKPSRLNSIAILGLLLAWPAASFAQLKVEVLETVKIHESHIYGYFPSLQMLSTGELICDFSLHPDTDEIEGSFWGYVVSTDKGKTWGMRHTAGAIYREAAYTRDPPLSDGSMLVVAGYPLPGPGDDYRNLLTTSCRLSAGGKTALYQWDVSIRLPQPAFRVKMYDKITGVASIGPGRIKEAAFFMFNGTLLAAQDGGWVTTMHGKFENDRYMRSVVVKSDRSGKNWEFVSSITSDELVTAAMEFENETLTSKRIEGFSEPRLVRLPDGRLFVVMRRGSNNVMYKAWSKDDGKTWTKPASIGFRGVEPAMLRMANGALALCTGRPDTIAVRFSTDDGESWGHATALTKGFENPDSPRGRGQKSTCYTGLVEVEPGKLLVVYDHLPFVEGWGLNPADKPEAMNTIYGTFVKVDR